MKSAVESKTRPSAGLGGKIVGVIGCITAVICIAFFLFSFGYYMPSLVIIDVSQPGIWIGALLQTPFAFAAILLLSFSVRVFKEGLQGDAAAQNLRILISFVCFMVCFFLNVANMFIGVLFNHGLASEISTSMLNLFMLLFFAALPALAVTLILLIVSVARLRPDQKVDSKKAFFLSLKSPAKWAVLLVLSVTFIFSGQRSNAGIRVDSFTSFQATDLAGDPVDQTIFSDHDLTLINVWATFCGPCIGEMPDLAELHEEYQPQGFQVVGICGDLVDGNTGIMLQDRYESALEIIRETHADAYQHLNPAGDLMSSVINSFVSAYPTSLFVDNEGNQVGDIIVGARDMDGWKAEIEERLEMIAQK